MYLLIYNNQIQLIELYKIMNNKLKKILACAVVLFTAGACELEEIKDPNFPSVGAVTSNASKAQLNALAIGQIAAARNGLATYLQVTGTIGKELFNFNGTESRWMTELNGTRPIDNSAFYNGATTAFGLPVRQANIILAAVDNTSSVTDQEKQAYRGLANTFKGLASLYMLNAQYTNGIRLDVTDPFNPSKPATYAQSLAGIAQFLDDGAAQLDAAGTAFPFDLPASYAGFNTPANFKKFNRAIALRVAIYQADWTKAAALLPQTFIDEAGSMNLGPKHSFSPSAPDIGNPLLSTASQIIVGVENIWDAAEPGDTRLSKVEVVNPELSYTSGVTYTTRYRAVLYTSATQQAPIIRNEELILIAAEIAAQQSNPTEAVRLMDIVRNAAGLPDYAGATTQADLINAILKERSLSLWYEGHRWVDMRRYNKLNEIAIPVAGMVVLERLERPNAEVNWDVANP
jgi:starch-binding outer membrane protein, SusD/RagB family